MNLSKTLFASSLIKLNDLYQITNETNGPLVDINEDQNPRNSFVRSGKFGPLPLPFPTSRLQDCVSQSIGESRMLADKEGAFVLTNADLLPSGGDFSEINITNDTVNLILVGDVGFNTPDQKRVIKAIDASVTDRREHNSYPLIMVLGDWGYPRGPVDDSSSEKDRIENLSLNAYGELSSQCDIYGVIGNHEYGDEGGPSDVAQFIKLAQSKGIKLDGRYYRQTFNARDFAIDIIVIDSTTIAVDDKQVNWLKSELERSVERESEDGTRRWRIVASHHPIKSFSDHAGENSFMSALFGRHIEDIDLMVCGHEHDLEVVGRTAAVPTTIISGSGCSRRKIAEHPKDAAFFGEEIGYGVINVHNRDIDIEMKKVIN